MWTCVVHVSLVPPALGSSSFGRFSSRFDYILFFLIICGLVPFMFFYVVISRLTEVLYVNWKFTLSL